MTKTFNSAIFVIKCHSQKKCCGAVCSSCEVFTVWNVFVLSFDLDEISFLCLLVQQIRKRMKKNSFLIKLYLNFF